MREDMLNEIEILMRNKYMTLTDPVKFSHYIVCFASNLDELKKVVNQAIHIRDNELTYEQWKQNQNPKECN